MFQATYARFGLWMKTLLSSVLSSTVSLCTCTGCCRSSLPGWVMNMAFLWLEHTVLNPTKVVSGWRREGGHSEDKVNTWCEGGHSGRVIK